MALATDPGLRSDETSHLLVLAPAALKVEARLAATAVAAVRPDLPVCVEATAPSLGALRLALESAVEVTGPATEVRETIAAALRATTVGAWLPSVARLADPNPGLALHARSLVARGAGFLAVAGAPGWVTRLPPPQTDVSRRISGLAEGDAVSFGELPEAAISALFGLGLAQRPARREPLSDTAARWGTAAAVEFALRTRVVARPPVGTCGICREPVWDAACPFCHAVNRGPAPSLPGVAL